ncbi:MAG: hypothetical protein GY715_15905 [Planctomycetes bacterium]|nr:hypothetical protein [Planctomycetota bacterium]
MDSTNTLTRNVRSGLVALALAGLVGIPAAANGPIAPGDDVWGTPCGGGAYSDFGANPLPADFFDPGSDPFIGNIQLGGDTNGIGIIPPVFSGIDTIVRRGGTSPTFTCGSSEDVPVQIIALSLVSCQPVTVTYNGGQSPEQWDVQVCLDGAPQPVGTMTINHECLNGGTYSSNLPVNAQLVFIRQGDGELRTLNQSVNMTSAAWWSHADPTFGLLEHLNPGTQIVDLCTGNQFFTVNQLNPDFFPGLWSPDCIDCAGPPGTFEKLPLTPEQAMLAAHGVFPANQKRLPGPQGPPVITEACCLPDGTCIDVPNFQCVDVHGGVPQGPGTNCANVICLIGPNLQACCYADGSCIDLPDADCLASGGHPQGPGTNCFFITCPLGEACCFPDGTCFNLPPGGCQEMGGDPQGAGTDCSIVQCCPDPGPCPWDLSNNGNVDFADILQVIANWGPCPPCCPWDLNGNGAVDFADILQIVANWGPCPCPPDDFFHTNPEEDTVVEFGTPDLPTLPPDFFEPGSDPFIGPIKLAGFGDPGTEGLRGLVDTVVRRSAAIDLGADPIGTQVTVGIELVELSLVGVEPVVVNTGGSQENWMMAMGLSANQQQGQLDVTKTHPTGGTATSIIPIKPRLAFANENDLNLLDQGVIPPDQVRIRILDFDEDGLAPIDLSWQGGPMPWSTLPPADGSFFCPSETFFIARDTGPDDTQGLPPHVPANSPGAAHFTCPPPPPPPGLCTYTFIGATPCFSPAGIICPGPCLAPPGGKVFLLCPVIGPCPTPPCPTFICVIRPCAQPGCFCIAFYRCVGCNPC